jgi:hypothetical protein
MCFQLHPWLEVSCAVVDEGLEELEEFDFVES